MKMDIGGGDPATPRSRRGAAAAFVDGLLERGRAAFPISDLMAATGLSVIGARRQLARMSVQVRRVAPRQAFFLILGPEQRVLGAPPATWWLDDYFRWLGRPYYLALQSAASEYGSAAHAIQVTQVMTDLPRRAVQLGRVRVQFFVKRAVARTPVQAITSANAPLVASTPEATAVDLVRYANRVGGLSRAAETIAPLVARLKRGALVRALEVDGEAPSAQRLASILADLGKPDLAQAIRARFPSTGSEVPT